MALLVVLFHAAALLAMSPPSPYYRDASKPVNCLASRAPTKDSTPDSPLDYLLSRARWSRGSEDEEDHSGDSGDGKIHLDISTKRALFDAVTERNAERVLDIIRSASEDVMDGDQLDLDYLLSLEEGNNMSQTLLERAIYQADGDTVKVLLEHGASPSRPRQVPGGRAFKSGGGETPLHQAIQHYNYTQHTTIIQDLIRAGSDLHARTPTTNSTILMAAAEYGDFGLLQYLLAMPMVRETVGWVDEDGMSVFHYLGKNEWIGGEEEDLLELFGEFDKKLLDAGTGLPEDIGDSDFSFPWMSPLEQAIQTGLPILALSLLRHGALPHSRIRLAHSNQDLAFSPALMFNQIFEAAGRLFAQCQREVQTAILVFVYRLGREDGALADIFINHILPYLRYHARLPRLFQHR